VPFVAWFSQKEELRRELKAKTPHAKQALAAAQSAQSALAQRLIERKAYGERDAATTTDVSSTERTSFGVGKETIASPRSPQIRMGNVPGSSI